MAQRVTLPPQVVFDISTLPAKQGGRDIELCYGRRMSAFVGRIERCGRPIERQHFEARLRSLPGFAGSRPHLQFGDGYAVAECRSLDSPKPGPWARRTPSDEIVIAADAVIDDRQSLLTALGLPPSQTAPIPDQELLRLAYLRWGEAFPRYLIGDFAVALYRPRARRLVLIRDHVGARPLFFSVRGDTVLFSSSIAALVYGDEFAWPLSEEAVARRLCFPAAPGKDSFFRDVRTVPPGGAVIIDGGLCHATRWWAPCVRPTEHGARADHAQACRHLLDRAIADRLTGAEPVAAHCSGGIDSTAVTVLAHRALVERGSALGAAYTWAPPQSDECPDLGARDERRRMDALSKQEGFDLRYGERPDYLAFLERPMELEGETDLADEEAILPQACRDGMRTILSGWGGDEAFSAHGFGHLCHLVMSGQWIRAQRFARHQTRSLRSLSAVRALVWEQIVFPLLPRSLQNAASPYRHYEPHLCFLSPDLALRHRELIAEHRQPPRVTSNPMDNLGAFIGAGHLAARMQTWAERGAASGIRYRYPLTDRRLVEYILSIPPEALFQGDRPRGLALATLEDVIPEYIGKHDPANEAERARAMTEAWRGLSRQMRDGRFESNCAWLDMAALRRAIASPEIVDNKDALGKFWEIFEATRVYRMFERRT